MRITIIYTVTQGMRRHIMKVVNFTLLILLTLSGCGGGGDSGSDDRETGYITPAGIGGLHYQTASQTGTTDAAGRFRYYPGERLSLSIGNLPLYDDIPVSDYITPLDFVASIRTQLDTAGLTDEGLLSHKPQEQFLIEKTVIMNLTRFLLSLNWEGNTADGKGIDIRQRVISQINAALPDLSGPVDFSVSEADFVKEGTSPSPANQLLARICFYPAGDELCETPPTPEEIAAAEPAPDNPEDRIPGMEYSEDLANKRDRIIKAIRKVDDVGRDEARQYLKRELDAISLVRANRYYLDEETANLSASDTSIKTVQIRKINGTPSLSGIEAKSTNPLDVVIHAYNRQGANVDYFIDGEAGKEGEVLINFKPSGDYRWIKKQLRVIIEP